MTEPRRRLPLVAMLTALLALGCSDDVVLPAPVPPPPDPGYTLLMVGGTAHSAARTEVLELVIEVSRDAEGHVGPVAFSADPPAGIVVIFRPSIVLASDRTDLLVVADGTVEPRQYDIPIRASAVDRPDRTLTLALTVTPGP